VNTTVRLPAELLPTLTNTNRHCKSPYTKDLRNIIQRLQMHK